MGCPFLIEGWVQTVLVTSQVDKSKISKHWKCIWDSSQDSGWGKVQFWICERDLKDDFLLRAREEFGGEAVQQVVRFGKHPQVEYDSL